MRGSRDVVEQPGSPGELLRLIRNGAASTRADLVGLTGLARSTVGQRVDQLLADELIVELGGAPSTGGRPPTLLGFNRDAGVVLAADLGATHSRLAVADLSAQVLASVSADIEIAEGPDVVLEWVEQDFAKMLAELGRTEADVLGIGLGVPGPVEFATGRAVHPPIMPGWDGYGIRDRLSARFGVPALVDNDVNIMAMGEWWAMAEPVDDFIFIKVGTGIGSGLILGGHIHRGTDGTAGDIGHIRVGDLSVACRCGKVGCLEAAAGGGALARQLAERGHGAVNSRDVVKLVRGGNQEAIQAVRDAGRLIGSVLATVVNLLNPSMIMIGGDVAEAGGELLARIREAVYRRSTALSTTHLQIQPSSLGDDAGITGAAAMAIEHILSPAAVNAGLHPTTGGAR